MSFAFIHPPTDARPSGGNRYNERILQQARRLHFGLKSIEVTHFDSDRLAQLNDTYTLLIWDSIFWSKLANLSSVLKSSRSSLLCHFLPSLNPRLSAQQQRQLSFQENLVLQQMRRVIVTGQPTANIIRHRFPGKPVDLAEPGIDPVFLQSCRNINTAGTPPQLLTVANLLPDKGYLDILYVLAELDDRCWQWHICGSDDIDAQFTRQFWQNVKHLGLAPQISYRGTLTPDQIAGVMQNTDIFVSASYYESFGMAVAEAAAMRLPIISSATGSANTMVNHAVNGFLFPPGDRQTLRHYLQLMLGDPILRVEFRSRQQYRCQTWQKCFVAFSSICKQAAENGN